MIAAGRLRHRINIEKRNATQDSTGDPVANWVALHSDVPAEIAPASAREFTSANSMLAQATAKITIRWREGIVASMRATHNGDIYNIIGALPDAETGRSHLTLYCTKGTNLG